MICAHCGSATVASPCSGCGRAPLLRGRFRLERALDRHGMHLEATDVQGSGARASMLVLPTPAEDVDERIASLNHALEPYRQIGRAQRGAMRKAFAHSFGGHPAVCIPISPVPGQSVGERHATRAATLGEQVRLLAGALDALAMLHAADPPRVHGAVAPGALYIDDRGEPTLIGAGLRHLGLPVPWRVPPHPDPELSPATDVYLLGVTAVAAALARPPWELVDATGVMRFDLTWPLHPLIRGVLQRMTRPASTNRPADAQQARAMLSRVEAALGSHPEAADMLHEVLTGPRLMSPEPPADEARLALPSMDREPTLPPKPTPTPARPAPTPPRSSPGPADPARSMLLVAIGVLLASIAAALLL